MARHRKLYNKSTNLAEPVEIRMSDKAGNVYVYLGTVNDRDAIDHSLVGKAGAFSMSYAQSRVIAPRKAVAGWQSEMVAYFHQSLYDIDEVR